MSVPAQRGVGAGQLGRLGIGRDARLVAFAAEAVHPHVGKTPQVTGQIFEVDTRAAVDLRRVFAGQQIDA